LQKAQSVSLWKESRLKTHVYKGKIPMMYYAKIALIAIVAVAVAKKLPVLKDYV